MTFTTKDWQNFPSTATPISEAALEDMETRVTDYTDDSLPYIDAKVHFGAVGDGVQDDTAEIQAALDFALSGGGRGEVILPPGTYRTTATLIVQGASVSLGGYRGGELSTIISADHTAGPAIQVKNRRSGLRNLEIASSATREAAAAGSNHGVLVEATDTAANYPVQQRFENLLIHDQPNSGLVLIGGFWLSEFRQISAGDNGRHGLVVDNGTFTGRTNTATPGISNFYQCEFYRNGGHSALLGSDNAASNRALRLGFYNCDFAHSAISAGSRKSADQVWLFGEACEFVSCAFDGSADGSSTASTRGALVYGRVNTLRANRFLNVTGVARLGGTIDGYVSRGSVIDEFTVVDTGTNASLDPAVTIDPDVEGARVWTETTAEIAALVNDDDAYSPLTRRVQVAIKETAQSVTSSTDLVNDTTLAVPLLAKERAQFRAVLFVDGAAAGDFKVGFTVPASATLRWGPSSGVMVDASDAIVVQATVTSGSLIFGTAGTGTVRVVELVGEVLTGGTAGDLQLQWAQGTSSGTATRVFGQSRLEVIR